jgi:Ca2+/Na+ antiporter
MFFETSVEGVSNTVRHTVNLIMLNIIAIGTVTHEIASSVHMNYFANNADNDLTRNAVFR